MLRRLLLILAGVLVATLVAEFALRWVVTVPEVSNPLYSFHDSDPVLGWRGKADVRMRFRRPDFDALIEHGPDGWRVPDPPPSPDATWRVLFLGDSYTWGWGVSQGEVFTDRLQRRLAPSIAIYNRGVNAFGTGQEYLLMQRELVAQKYDAVAVMFFQNDVLDNVGGRDGRRPLFVLEGDTLVARNQPALPLTNPVHRFLKDHSQAFLLVDFELSQLKPSDDDAREKAFETSPTDVDYHELPGAAVTMRLLTEMNKLAAAHGARFVLVYLPQSSEADHPASPFPYIRAVHAMIRDVAAADGIPLVDLSGPFREQTQRGRTLFFPHDAHWTPDGHEMAAEVLSTSPIVPSPPAAGTAAQ